MNNFQALPGYSGDAEFSETQEAAYIANNTLPSTQKTAAGEILSGFLESFLKNKDAISMNNQAIAQYNLEKAKKQSEEGTQTLIMLGAMILVFVLAVYTINN